MGVEHEPVAGHSPGPICPAAASLLSALGIACIGASCTSEANKKPESRSRRMRTETTHTQPRQSEGGGRAKGEG